MIPKVTRRSAVALATAGLVAGCSGGGGTASGASGAADPGAAVRARAARDSTALAARYDAVAAVHPALAERLAPLRADTVSHVRAFGGKAPGTPGGGSAARATGLASQVPDTKNKALAWLAAAEKSLADRRSAALLDAPGDLARLLASVAASGAGHVALLGPRQDAATGTGGGTGTPPGSTDDGTGAAAGTDGGTGTDDGAGTPATPGTDTGTGSVTVTGGSTGSTGSEDGGV
jgi:hypothetical protein